MLSIYLQMIFRYVYDTLMIELYIVSEICIDLLPEHIVSVPEDESGVIMRCTRLLRFNFSCKYKNGRIVHIMYMSGCSS